ncbi:MAG: glutamate-5-semialdehyde dehydrogenase [Nitrospinaceae bacterium]
MSEQSLEGLARQARDAARVLARISSAVKNRALEQMAQALESNTGALLEANRKDMEFAGREGLAGPLVARLALNENKISGMVRGIRSVAALADPVGEVQVATELDTDLTLTRVSCPIGVIGAIFESRPDAVPQIGSLCLKSGNAVILKGGVEAQHSNRKLCELLRGALRKLDEVPENAIQLIQTRDEVTAMLKQDRYIDLIVPRGSNAFVRYVQDHTKIPVLGHSAGICHVYLDIAADPEKAVAIALDSKLQYPAACNALETLLIHQDLAPRLLPALVKGFLAGGVALRACRRLRELDPSLAAASEEDWDAEYNDLILSMKAVEGLDEAVNHINTHGSGHTDTIVTEDEIAAERFFNEVDSASVMWNASTRFADGFRYGLGAEIGISTNKTHARGPVGLEGLVIYKYRVVGAGQKVADYAEGGTKTFKHRPLPVESLRGNNGPGGSAS